MDWEKLTIEAQKVISDAEKKAESMCHTHIGIEHLLYAILTQETGIIKPLFAKLGVGASIILSDLEQELQKKPHYVEDSALIDTTAAFDNAIDTAFDEASRLKYEYVSIEHLLIGITEIKRSYAAQILKINGITENSIYAVLEGIQRTQHIPDQDPGKKYLALPRYLRDPMEETRKEIIDPAIGEKGSMTEIEFGSSSDARWNTQYQAIIRHDKLNKHQVIKGKDNETVKQKALAIKKRWDAQWDKELNISVASKRTQEAMQEIRSLTKIISTTLRNNENIVWSQFYNLEGYFDLAEPKPPVFKLKPFKSQPIVKPVPPSFPPEPKLTDPQYKPYKNIMDRIFKSRAQIKEKEMEDKLRSDHKRWVDKKKKMEMKYSTALLQWEKEIKKNEINYQKALEEWEKEKKEAIENWEKRKQEYTEDKNKAQITIDKKKQDYLNGTKELVIDQCHKILSNDGYPDYFPKSYVLDYLPSNKMVIIDYQLPSLLNIPTLKEVQYIQSKDQFKENHMSQSQKNNLYDSVVYQIVLSTIYALFNANHEDVIVQIVFNGFVESISPSTGKKTVACIVSLQTNRNEFMEINLANVDPKACFRKLKGVGSSQLYTITPIAPILDISREDKRFISSYDVAHELDESINIAAMDWEDFEHLIRELFEKEFSQYGGEVRITQASRDRGVDAVAFDPDPIRGGKIVIQAKRYTNTVGVSAVRDLYGTVINEGATKGILISTADYGPDAYEFAKGKPLTLLNGGNLLHLLEKHGHKANIDLREAKKIIAEQEKQKEKMH